MFSEESKTFNVATLDEDAVVFLFDILYEKLGIFKQQYWLGTIAMQNPFDMMSITDIIYTVRPDLIIETGVCVCVSCVCLCVCVCVWHRPSAHCNSAVRGAWAWHTEGPSSTN